MTSTQSDILAGAEAGDIRTDLQQMLPSGSDNSGAAVESADRLGEIIEHDQRGGSRLIALGDPLSERDDHEMERQKACLDALLKPGEPFLYRPLPHDFYSFELVFGGAPP